jgi:hypothetical protein
LDLVRHSNLCGFAADRFQCKIRINNAFKAAISESIEAPWPRLKTESTANREACEYKLSLNLEAKVQGYRAPASPRRKCRYLIEVVPAIA